MNLPFEPRPFPIPVVGIGPGSQVEEEGLNYPSMPKAMQTYQVPSLPEPEQMAHRAGALDALRAVKQALTRVVAGGVAAPIALDRLDARDRALVDQVLGEGEVSARIVPRDGTGQVDMQESVFAGVWRVVENTSDGQVRDRIEVGRIPALVGETARDDARAARPTPPAVPPQVVNAPSILVELEAQRAMRRDGDAPHVVNLTLLPMTHDDIAYMDHVLGTGRVLVLSRGYGNCRVTNTCVPDTWRVVYYNSQDVVILNSVEVTPIPDVACAAPEDLADSLERLDEVLAWVESA